MQELIALGAEVKVFARTSAAKAGHPTSPECTPKGVLHPRTRRTPPENKAYCTREQGVLHPRTRRTPPENRPVSGIYCELVFLPAISSFNRSAVALPGSIASAFCTSLSAEDIWFCFQSRRASTSSPSTLGFRRTEVWASLRALLRSPFFSSSMAS